MRSTPSGRRDNCRLILKAGAFAPVSSVLTTAVLQTMRYMHAQDSNLLLISPVRELTHPLQEGGKVTLAYASEYPRAPPCFVRHEQEQPCIPIMPETRPLFTEKKLRTLGLRVHSFHV